MKIFVMKRILIGLIVISAMIFAVSAVMAAPERKMFRAEKGRETVVHFEGLQLVVPADTAQDEMFIGKGDPDFTGIQKPYLFKPVSPIFTFGPHGLKFNDKPLKVKMNLKNLNIPEEYALEDVKLYYLNRETKQMESVPDQKINAKEQIIEADLKHFSEYVYGVSPAWDGNGLNPFADYVHDGDEHVLINGLALSIVSKFYSVEGRGMNLDFYWISPGFVSDRYTKQNPFYLGGAYLSCVPYVWDKVLFLPKGLSYSLHNHAREIAFSVEYVDWPYGEGIKLVKSVLLGDGTKITLVNQSQYHQIITDRNGNSVELIFGDFVYNCDHVTLTFPRIALIKDSIGRTFKFYHDRVSNSSSYYGGPIFKKMEQQCANGTLKPILTYSYTPLNGEAKISTFTDANGLSTTYHPQDGIIYPNGTRSKYYFNSYGISKHEIFYPDNSTPAKITQYFREDNGYRIRVVNSEKTKVYIIDRWWGWINQEDTLSPSGVLHERIVRKYYQPFSEADESHNFSNKLKEISTYQCNSDGSLGTCVNYQFKYDAFGNTNRIVDPYGNETRLAYSNSSSESNLSRFNSLYQDYLYSGASGNPCWEMPLTKATIIKNPINNTAQLKQTHYQYDSRGNIIRESEVYNSSYIHTDYTYDQYGNLLSTRDGNGNTLYYEYEDSTVKPYKSAFLTRVYNALGIILATFEYDFDLGKKTKATDPNGNIFIYGYDAIGRLTNESLFTP